MLKAYGTTVTCRAILDDPKDDLAAQRSLSDLEQARRDAR
jgi:hypothetical protein